MFEKIKNLIISRNLTNSTAFIAVYAFISDFFSACGRGIRELGRRALHARFNWMGMIAVILNYICNSCRATGRISCYTVDW